MRRIIQPLVLGIVVFIIYFGINSRFTFHPRWDIDYFNPLAQSLIRGRLDIPNPQQTYDLLHVDGKWFTPWGLLPSLFLIPLQVLKGRFVPAGYLSFLFGSLNVCIMWLMALRLRKEILPAMRMVDVWVVTLFFAFGTANFYVGTLGSVWHVSQMVSAFFGNAGIYMILRKQRKISDYFLSSLLISISFIGRVTTAFLILLPVYLFVWDVMKKKVKLWEGVVIALPFLSFLLLFLGYNAARFGNPFDTGYAYITESPYLASLREAYGMSSVRNVPRNLWYMTLEMPKVSLFPRPQLHLNLLGNSIFFLSPPLLYIFRVLPFAKKRKYAADMYIRGIWATVLLFLVPILMHYSTGWMQLGYRYTLEIAMLLVVLTVFALKGRVTAVYCAGVLFSIIMYSWGNVAMR